MDRLYLSQFTYTPNTAGVNSPLLSFTVPLNTYYALLNSEPMHIALPSFFSQSYTSAQSSDNVTVTAPTPVAVVAGTYNVPNYSLTAIGYWYNGTTYRPVPATNISGSNITFNVNDTTSTTATLYVYYLPAQGNVTIAYSNPSGSSSVPSAMTTVTKVIFKRPLMNIHSLDQQLSYIHISENSLLPQFFQLTVYVNSSVVLYTNSVNANYPNTLAFLDLPVSTGNMSELLQKMPNAYRAVMQQMVR